ncbi:hypothetical protein FAUST_109 [Fusarium austroamericanum]|uniref:Uncharacterized protein n=1 Tax=Fusarium austroamericanum TaxID=282268 RepID=A0AAN6CB15_FUSAU|nr:hypothetical protein FAUST_109 [Fusarium austroamericanum]
MSSSVTIQEPNRLFALPSEILFNIMKETTQKEECWINLLTKGKSPCGATTGVYSVLVYTKGGVAQGPRTFPCHHKCIFKRPVADGKIGVEGIANKNLELSLRENRLRSQLNVYERSLDSDLVDNVRSICLRLQDEDITPAELRLMCQRFPVLSRAITEVLPFTDAVYGCLDTVRPSEPNPGAREKRLLPSDDMFECQRLKHAMICSSPWEGRAGDVIDRVLVDANPLAGANQTLMMQTYLRMILSERKIEDDIALLNIDWSLLSGLESFCFDLNTASWRKSLRQLRSMLLSMGRHLKLKTLVVLDFGEGTLTEPNVIASLTSCLQPGGELHLIS